eukprot:gb/GEZN01012844.1/.p1 GENE.gb/GEZN01012844.1/~~gb/GEZN01012844.1/.p1  ORF type:complete len:192 (-),score=27.69 gb/GEZN01012844.1/:404-979(-)
MEANGEIIEIEITRAELYGLFAVLVVALLACAITFFRFFTYSRHAIAPAKVEEQAKTTVPAGDTPRRLTSYDRAEQPSVAKSGSDSVVRQENPPATREQGNEASSKSVPKSVVAFLEEDDELSDIDLDNSLLQVELTPQRNLGAHRSGFASVGSPSPETFKYLSRTAPQRSPYQVMFHKKGDKGTGASPSS